jgi:hypothetical protein
VLLQERWTLPEAPLLLLLLLALLLQVCDYCSSITLTVLMFHLFDVLQLCHQVPHCWQM